MCVLARKTFTSGQSPEKLSTAYNSIALFFQSQDGTIFLRRYLRIAASCVSSLQSVSLTRHPPCLLFDLSLIEPLVTCWMPASGGRKQKGLLYTNRPRLPHNYVSVLDMDYLFCSQMCWGGNSRKDSGWVWSNRVLAGFLIQYLAEVAAGMACCWSSELLCRNTTGPADAVVEMPCSYFVWSSQLSFCLHSFFPFGKGRI